MTTTTMCIAPARHRHRHLYFCLYLYFTSTSVATLAQASQSEYVFPLPWSGMSGPYDEAFHEAFVPRHPGWAELGIRGWAEIGRDLAAEIDGKGKGKGTGKGWVYTWEQFEEDEGVLFLQLQRHMGTAGPAGAIARTISRVLWVYKGKGKGKDGTSNADDGGMIITGADDNEEGGTSNADEGGMINTGADDKKDDDGQIEKADDKAEGGTSNDEGGTIIEGADDKKDDEGQSVHPPRATLAEIVAEVSGLTRGERTDGACSDQLSVVICRRRVREPPTREGGKEERERE